MIGIINVLNVFLLIFLVMNKELNRELRYRFII